MLEKNMVIESSILIIECHNREMEFRELKNHQEGSN